MNRITLAPTTLPNTLPLEYLEAAVSAGTRRFLTKYYASRAVATS
jgi:hypothetical protein